MQQGDEKEKEIVIGIVMHVLEALEKYKGELRLGDVLAALIHIIGFSLPTELDEEDLRHFAHVFHQQINESIRDRKKNEPV